jgi:hypothetical protein
MDDDVFVPVTSDLLEIVYKDAINVPFAIAENMMRQGEGVLSFMGTHVAILYGISYHKSRDEYVVFANFGGSEFLDTFKRLPALFAAYGLDYKYFRYIDLHKLNKVALDRRIQRKETASARTNYDD